MIYTHYHRTFFSLNGALNIQTEKQVGVLELRSTRPALAFSKSLRRQEVWILDAEAELYGLVFVVLLIAIMFNLWQATGVLAFSTGAILAIISYSWNSVDGMLTLHVTLQSWTWVSEIMRHLNRSQNLRQ